MQHPALALSSRVLRVLSQIADSLACRRALVCLGRTQSRDAAGSHLEVHMQMTLKTLLAVAAVGFATQAAAQITFYEGEGFRGRAFTTDKQVWNFERYGFNDRASSAVVNRGRWEVCEDARFEGRCVVLRPGSYESLSGMGMNNRISSVRPVGGREYYSNAGPDYEYRQRPNNWR